MAGKGLFRSLSRLVHGDPDLRLQRMIFREASRAFGLEQAGFPGTLLLPSPFGKGLPERVIELVLVRTAYAAGVRVLDVGHSNIMECHRLLLNTLARPKHLTGIDIADPVYDVHDYYERSIKADITGTGLETGSFDRIWCISTLEHVGMDNTGYTRNFTLDAERDGIALEEMFRLLAVGGTLLITVPFGRFENHGWMKNYDLSSWHRLLDPLRPSGDVHELYFRYVPAAGWAPALAADLASTGYYDNANAGASGLAAAVIRKSVPSHAS